MLFLIKINISNFKYPNILLINNNRVVNTMKNKTFNVKNLYRGTIVAIALTAVTIGYSSVTSNYFKKGYEEGRKMTKQQTEMAANRIIENCEHYMGILKTYMHHSSNEEQKRFQGIYFHTLDKRNDVQSLLGDILNDNITIDKRDKAK